VRVNPRKILLTSVAVAVVLLFGGAAAWGVQEYASPSDEPQIAMSTLDGLALDGLPPTDITGTIGVESDVAQELETPEGDRSLSSVTGVATPEVELEFSVELRTAIDNSSPMDLDGLLLHNAGVDPFEWRPNAQSCDGLERGVVVDRGVQRGWFCEDSAVLTHFVLTSSDLQPDPGDYAVYAKDLKAWSWEFGPPSTMTHFVAFTRGKFKGARVAFHSVPKYSDGSWAQPLESVGTLERFGDSSGCIRLLPEDAVALWEFLDIGGTVRVIS
jgi:hypothetical protein